MTRNEPLDNALTAPFVEGASTVPHATDVSSQFRETGRTERRVPFKVAVKIARRDDPTVLEDAVTENISSGGIRVLTSLRCEPEDKLVVSLLGDSRLNQARVVYHQQLSLGQSAIGIVFESHDSRPA